MTKNMLQSLFLATFRKEKFRSKQISEAVSKMSFENAATYFVWVWVSVCTCQCGCSEGGGWSAVGQAPVPGVRGHRGVEGGKP